MKKGWLKSCSPDRSSVACAGRTPANEITASQFRQSLHEFRLAATLAREPSRPVTEGLPTQAECRIPLVQRRGGMSGFMVAPPYPAGAIAPEYL
jgi:hypothetical protein